LLTRLMTEQSERGKMENDMARRSEDLAAVREDLRQAVDKISAKDSVICDLGQQMALLQHEVWISLS